MTDILFRKEMLQRGMTAQALAGHFTLTPADVAAQLGVTVSAVPQAIDAGRLGARVKAGHVFVDPRSLATFKLSPRGPKPHNTTRMARAKARKTSHVVVK